MTSTSSVQDKIQVFINSHPEYEGKPLSEISSELVSAGVLTTEELSTLDSTSTFSIANKDSKKDENVDSFEHVDNPEPSESAETTETIIEHGNEVIVKKKGEELIEKVIKEKIPNSEEVKTITITYAKGKPFTKKVQTGDSTEEYLYSTETLATGEEVVAIKKVDAEGKSVEQTVVKNVDENGDYTDDDFEYRKTLYLEDAVTDSNIGVKAGSIKEVAKSKKGDLIESVQDPSGSHIVTTQFNGGSVTQYDNDNLYFKRQEIVDNGNVTNVVDYDGKGNTYVTIRNGDGVESITKYFNDYIKKHGLDKTRRFTTAEFERLNKKALSTTGLQVGKKALVPTQYNANAPILTKRGTTQQAMNKYAQFAFEQTKERLASSTIEETTLNKTYSNYEELAKEQLVSQGVHNPTKEQINDRANELIALNSNGNKPAVLKKGAKISVVSNQASASDVSALKSAGFKPTVENNAFYRKFNTLNPNDKQRVMSVINSCKGMDINQIKAFVYENTGINLYDTNIMINEHGTTSVAGMNVPEQFKVKVPLEYLITKRMGLDLNSKNGREIYERLRSLPQGELDKISASEFVPEGNLGIGTNAIRKIRISKNASVKDVIGTMHSQGVDLRTPAEIRMEQSTPAYKERQRKEQAISMLYSSVNSAYKIITEHLDELKHHMLSNIGEIIFEDVKHYAVPDAVKMLASYISEGDGTVEGLTKSIFNKRDELEKMLYQINQLRNSKNFEADYKKLTGHDYNPNEIQEYLDLQATLRDPLTRSTRTSQQMFQLQERLNSSYSKIMGIDRAAEARKFTNAGQTAGSVIEMAGMIYLTGGMGELGYIKNAGTAVRAVTGSRILGTGIQGAMTLGSYTAARETLNVIDDFANANNLEELTAALGDRGMKVLEHSGSSALFGFVGGATAEKLFTMSKGAQNFVSKGFSKLFGKGVSSAEGAATTFTSDAASSAGKAFAPSTKAISIADKALEEGTQLSGSQLMTKVMTGTNSLNAVGKTVSLALETLTFSGVEISEQAVVALTKELFNDESELKQAIANNTLDDYIKTKIKNAPESILNTLKEQGINMLMLKAVSFAIGAHAANNMEGMYESLDKAKIYKAEIDGEMKIVIETEKGKVVCNSTADALSFFNQSMTIETMMKSAETTNPENEFEWAKSNGTNPAEQPRTGVLEEGDLPVYTRSNLPENSIVMPSTNLVISTVTNQPIGRLTARSNNPVEVAQTTGFTPEQARILESKGVSVDALNEYLRAGFAEKPETRSREGVVGAKPESERPTVEQLTERLNKAKTIEELESIREEMQYLPQTEETFDLALKFVSKQDEIVLGNLGFSNEPRTLDLTNESSVREFFNSNVKSLIDNNLKGTLLEGVTKEDIAKLSFRTNEDKKSLVLFATGNKPAILESGLDKATLNKFKNENVDAININNGENTMLINKAQAKEIIGQNLELFRYRTGLGENASVEDVYNAILTKDVLSSHTDVKNQSNDIVGMLLGYPPKSSMIFNLEFSIPKFDYQTRYHNDLTEYKQTLKNALYSENSPYKNMSEEFKSELAKTIDSISEIKGSSDVLNTSNGESYGYPFMYYVDEPAEIARIKKGIENVAKIEVESDVSAVGAPRTGVVEAKPETPLKPETPATAVKSEPVGATPSVEGASPEAVSPYKPTSNPTIVKRPPKEVFRINEVLTEKELSTDLEEILTYNEKGNIVLSQKGEELVTKLAEQIHKVAQEAEPDILKTINQMGLDKGQKFTYRSKSVQSLHDKIQNALLEPIKKGESITLEQALDDVRDAEGIRTIFEAQDYTSNPEVQALLQSGDKEGAIRRAAELQSNDTFEALKGYIDSVADGTNEVELIKMSNYMGKDGIPYFSENQLMALKQYAASKGVKMPIFERVTIQEEADGSKVEIKNPKATTKVRGSGYTALQANFRTKNGFIFEGQWRGPKVDPFAEAEHPPYDIRTGKDIIGAHPELKNIYEPIIDMLKGENKISDIMFDEHSAYLTAHYEYLRQTELGFEDGTNPPKFPRGLDARLRAENLELLHEYVEKIKKEPAREAELRAEYESKLVQNTPENTTDVRYNPVSPERLAYENTKEQLLKYKDNDGLPRFNEFDLENLKDEMTSNSDLVLKLAEMKNPDGSYMVNPLTLKGLVDAIKDSPETGLALLNMKNPDGTYRFNTYTLSNAMKLRAKNPEVFDAIINLKRSDGAFAVDSSEINSAFEAMDKIGNNNFALMILNESDSQGTSRFTDFVSIQDFVRIRNGSPDDIAKFKAIYDARTPDGRYKYTMEMVRDLYRESKYNGDYEGLKARYDAISDYMMKNNIPIEAKLVDTLVERKYDLFESSDSHSENIELLYETKGSSVKVIFDADGNFVSKRVLTKQSNAVEESLVTNRSSSRMSITYDSNVKDFNKMISSTKEVRDNQGNLLYTEKYVESKDAAGKYNIIRTDANGREWLVGLAEHSESGNLVIEKSLEGADGTKTDYFYSDSPKGERLSVTRITDKDGNVLLNNSQQFKVIDENHFQSVENGVKYDMQFTDDKIVVKKENGETVEFKIGDKNSKLYITPEIVPLLKELPGSVLFDMDAFSLRAIGVGIDGVQQGNAHFDSVENIVSMSTERFNNDEVFTLLHELGHAKDYNSANRVSNNQELNEIFNEEFAEFKKKQSSMEADAIKYLTARIFGHGGLEEMTADTHAYLYANNKWSEIEQRGQYLQQYFPKTFAKIAELLKTTTPRVKPNTEVVADAPADVVGVKVQGEMPSAEALKPSVTSTVARPLEFDEAKFRDDLKSYTQHKTNNIPRFTEAEINELVELRKTHPEIEDLVNYNNGIPLQLKVEVIKEIVSYAETKPELYKVVISDINHLHPEQALEILKSDFKDTAFLENILSLRGKNFRGEDAPVFAGREIPKLTDIYTKSPELAQTLVERTLAKKDFSYLMPTVEKLSPEMYSKAAEIIGDKQTLADGTTNYTFDSTQISVLTSFYGKKSEIADKLRAVYADKTIDETTMRNFNKKLLPLLRDMGVLKTLFKMNDSYPQTLEHLTRVNNPTTPEEQLFARAGIDKEFVETKYSEKYGNNSFVKFSAQTINLLNDFYRTSPDKAHLDYINNLLKGSVDERVVSDFLNKDESGKNDVIIKFRQEQSKIATTQLRWQSGSAKAKLNDTGVLQTLALMKMYNPENYNKLVHSKGFKMIKEGKLNVNLLSDVRAMDTINDDYFYNLFDAKEQDFNTRYESSPALKEYDKDMLFKIIDIIDPARQNEILKYIENAKDPKLMKHVLEKNIIRSVEQQESNEKNEVFELPADTQNRGEMLIDLMRLTAGSPHSIRRAFQFNSNLASLRSLASTELSVKLTNQEKDAVYTLFSESQQKFKNISATDVQAGLRFMEKYKDLDMLKTLTSQKQGLSYSFILSAVNENNIGLLKSSFAKTNGVVNIAQVSLLGVLKSYPEMKDPRSPEAQRVVTAYNEVTDAIRHNLSERMKRIKEEYNARANEIKSRDIPESEKRQLLSGASQLSMLNSRQTINALYTEVSNRKGLIDIKLKDPAKYERLKESGILDMVDSGELDSSILRHLNVSSDFAPEVYADLEAVKNGESIIPEFREGTTPAYAFSKTKVGDAVAIGDKMYINDGNNLVEWKMTKDKYLELFPPVKRFLTQQRGLGDCYFVSSLTNSMLNPKARVGIYQSFEQNGNDISVTIKDYNEYGGTKTYKDSKLDLDNRRLHVAGAKGIQMYEQTYAKVALRHSYFDPTPLGEPNTPEVTMRRIASGHPIVAMSEIHSVGVPMNYLDVPPDFKTGSIAIHKITPEKLTNILSRFANNDNVMLGFGTSPKTNARAESMLDSRYNILSSHAYSIRGYDKDKGVVIINNPHNSGTNTEVPIDVLAKYMDECSITVLDRGSSRQY